MLKVEHDTKRHETKPFGVSKLEAFRTVRAVEMALALTEANIEALPKVQFGHPDAPEDRKGEAARDVRRYARLPSVVCFDAFRWL